MNNSDIVLPPNVPEEARGLLVEVGYFEPDPLKVGDMAPHVELMTLEGDRSQLLGGAAPRPVLLIFGSYT